MRLIIAAFMLLCSVQTCFGWSEGGHHLIAVIAFEQLSPQQQKSLFEILASHPRFTEDFTPPEKLNDQKEIDRWMIGRAGFWPDVARRTKFDRPDWHWQLGPNLTIGDVAGVPDNPGPCPADASFNSKELHIAQAVELCRQTWRDTTRSRADRALALCWLAHLVGDAHQPCHAGSLYSPVAFPGGDRGGNSIPTKQRKNLHSLWDSLLGPKFDSGDTRRRKREILSNRELAADAKKAANSEDGLNPLKWLAESSELSRTFVYTPEVLEPIEAVDRKLVSKLEPIDLSESYLKAAGALAQKRAVFAGYRLAKILIEGVE